MNRRAIRAVVDVNVMNDVPCPHVSRDAFHTLAQIILQIFEAHQHNLGPVPLVEVPEKVLPHVTRVARPREDGVRELLVRYGVGCDAHVRREEVVKAEEDVQRTRAV